VTRRSTGLDYSSLAPSHPQDRIVNDAFSSIGICDCVQHRCLEGWEQGKSLNSRHHPEQPIDGVASTIVRGRSIGQCLETPIHHMAREPIRSTTEVARVTLRHTRREYLEVPSTRVGHIDLEVSVWWVERHCHLRHR
jgi:hypothetical protein